MTRELWSIHYEVLSEEGKQIKTGFIFYDLMYASFEQAKNAWAKIPEQIAASSKLGNWCTVAFTNCNLLKSETMYSPEQIGDGGETTEGQQVVPDDAIVSSEGSS